MAFRQRKEAGIFGNPPPAISHYPMQAGKARCRNCLREGDLADRVCPSCGIAYAAASAGSGLPSSTPTTDGSARDRLIERLRKATEGRFDIIRLLGRGGMAAVYLAYDLRLDRKVALKVMLPSVEFTDGMADRFAREARTAARLTHPHIMTVHDVIELDDLVLIVMNLITGASVEQVVSCFPLTPSLGPRQLPIPVTQYVLRQVASALEFAHGERVIHRDIKPSNVMITIKGDAIITDFGIAKVTADFAHTTGRGSTVMGTPTYMSPEQWKGQPVTGAADQYSLGVMAYELLAGEPPFLGTMLNVQVAHIESEPQALELRRPDVPVALMNAIMRMLAKRPAERFPNMTSVVEALSAGFDPTDLAPRRALASAASRAVEIRDDPDVSTRSTPPESRRLSAAPVKVTSVVVIVPQNAVAVGETFNVLASARDANGNEVAGYEMSIVSENPDVVAVSGSRGTAVAPGRARIIASGAGAWSDAYVSVAVPSRFQDDSDTTRLKRVRGPRVAVLRMDPAPAEVSVGDTFTLRATPLTEQGISVSGRVVAWSSDSPAVATISPDGGVRAVGKGRVKFTASCEDIRATAVTLVTPAGVSGRRERPRPLPKRQRVVWPWILAAVASLAAGYTYYRYGAVSRIEPGAIDAGARPGASGDSTAAAPYGEAVTAEIARIGYRFGGAAVTESFTVPQAFVSNGRLSPPAQAAVINNDAWNVHSASFVAHVEIAAAATLRGGRGTGAGFVVAAADKPGTRFYAVVVRGGPSPDVRVVQSSESGMADVARPTPVDNDGSGLIKLDVLVYQGGIHVFVGGKPTGAPAVQSKFVLGGQFGLYTLPGDPYSFSKLAVAAINVR